MSDLDARIPNNVGLSGDRRLQRALLRWQPGFLRWWNEMGPEGFQGDDVFLRTAVSVEPSGWSHFDYVRMPDYRWGIFLAPAEEDRRIGFGDFLGQPVWQQVPGEFRADLRRLIVTQGDTEPASVEQQRMLGKTAPSLYDLRNLFQVNVEEGRHLWAMVYLLHSWFGRDGREEAEALLARQSGDEDRPRILQAFNEPIDDWLNFYLFTMFTDRDGKYQLLALAESAFDPLSRTTRFMLTEEAFHMSVGETGVGRIIERTAVHMAESDQDPRAAGLFDLALIQRHINFWFTASLDLFGSEISSNAAHYFASGLKGRAREKRRDDHAALDGVRVLDAPEGEGLVRREVPLRNAMNEALRDDYIADCRRGLKRWNRILESRGLPDRLTLPSRRFHRRIGIYAGGRFHPDGNLISESEWAARRDRWLPTDDDRKYVRSLMVPVTEPGKIANWIAEPRRGVHGRPFGFEYVRRA